MKACERIIINRRNALRDKYEILGRSQPNLYKWQVRAAHLPEFWKGGLTVSLDVSRLMIWLEEKQGNIFQSRRNLPGDNTAVSSLQTPALHHSGCTQNLLSAPKICHLHLLCAAAQISPEAQTPPLQYPLLCQPLGHLETSFARIGRLADLDTADHRTTKISGHALTAKIHRKCCHQH